MSYAIRNDGLGWRSINSESDVIDGEYFTTVAPPVPPLNASVVVTPWQIRKALNQLNLRSQVETAVAASNQETKDGWEFATEFRSDSPLIANFCNALGKTEAERIALFELAATL